MMDTRAVVTRYYELADGGDWDAWTDLFAIGLIMDEQLAGRVEGRENLRQMMKGFPAMYATFKNVPRHIVVEDDHAAVISHISATAPDGQPIEAEVANYFQIADGQITYMSTCHDTAPFQPVLTAP